MSNTSWSRNAARSSGDSRSSVTISATEMSSAVAVDAYVLHDRLGQPRAHVLLAPRPRRLEPIETQPRHHPRQVRARDLHARAIGALPAQERVLHGVLGFGDDPSMRYATPTR